MTILPHLETQVHRIAIGSFFLRKICESSKYLPKHARISEFICNFATRYKKLLF